MHFALRRLAHVDSVTDAVHFASLWRLQLLVCLNDQVDHLILPRRWAPSIALVPKFATDDDLPAQRQSRT